MRKAEIERLIKPVAVGPSTVSNNISYNYMTKTSARRGGYNRVRTISYWWDGVRLFRATHRIDDLTGEASLPTGAWSIPAPPEYHGMIAMNVGGIFRESVQVGAGFRCMFWGSESSARLLCQDPLEGADKITSVGGRLPDFTLFFPLDWRAKFWVYPNKITIMDGVIIEQEKLDPPPTDENVRLFRPAQQLSLFSN